MKAFFRQAALLALLSPGAALASAEIPTISGAWTELRKAPVFGAETLPLARTWGPTLAPGTGFQVEKVYGRWVFGRPVPPRNMLPADFAPSGWVFGRMLLVPGDEDVLTAAQASRNHSFLYHARAAWKKLGLGKEPLVSELDFLESLTLSRKTLTAFSRQDDESGSGSSWFWPVAEAAEGEEAAPSMGLTGPSMNFLDQEISVIQAKKKEAEVRRQRRKLAPPKGPALDDAMRTGILGRYMLHKYLELPPLTMEEVDGFIYMKATATRALEGCPKDVQDYWKGRRWNHFRVFRLRSRPEDRHPWFEVALPGGYFALSARAIDHAANEAELAFLLVRPLVRELRLKRDAVSWRKRNWPDDLAGMSEELWDKVLRAQSTKDAADIDVSDEIALDLTAAECISRAGYRPLASVAYLRKLAMNREEPWARWLREHSIGMDYRVERLLGIVQEAVAKQKFPEGRASNAKRFNAAAKQWNILP